MRDALNAIRNGDSLARWRKPVLTILAALAILAVLYYPIGMAVVSKVDDDLAFGPGEVPAGASRAVALAADLIDREVSQHGWTANDPFFQPGAALDNMPSFQQGVVSALSRFAIEMSDQIGRTRGSSAIDPDLDKAAGLLKYPGDVWVFDFSTSWAPTATSEKQYLAAERALRSYNARLAGQPAQLGDGSSRDSGRIAQAVFEPRADNLLATLDRISKDLGSASASLDQRIGQGLAFSTTADDLFYSVKGRVYAYHLLLRELEADFGNVIAERELSGAWQQMLSSFAQAATLDPALVMNADPDSMLLPSHLTAQGFYLLRARTQLGEIMNILLK